MEKTPSQSEAGALIGQVLNLAELVDYQEGAVVSRTIIDQPTGTVTLFAFDQGQGLSEHTAPFDALVYVLEGQVDITIAGEVSPVHEGQMIIMPAQQPHALTATEKLKMLLIMIRS